MNLRRINYHCSCGSCDECTGGNAKSYFEGMEQKPNIQEIIPIAGPSGKASLTVASVTDGTTDTAGTDVAIGGSTIADLTTLGFDVTTKPTLKVTPDPTDLNNTKVFIRESNGFLNFLASFKTKLLPSGSEGNILKYVSGLWTSSAPDWEKYNCTTTTDLSYTIADVGTTKNFTVPSGLSYRFKNAFAIASPADPLNNYLEVVVVAYSGVTLSIAIKNIKGTGGTVNWNVMLTAPEYLPYVNDPANYGKFFYNNNGIIEMRTSIESVGDTKITLRPPALDPVGWLGFDGVPRDKTEYPALYDYLNYISSTFISGDNFILPNLAGRALVGVDGGAEWPFIGSVYGEKTHVLTIPQLPTHNHPLTTYNIPVFNNPDTDRGASSSKFSIDDITTTASQTGDTGSGAAHNNIQPSLAVRVIIKAV